MRTLFCLKKFVGIDSLHLTGDLDRKFRRIEGRNAAYPTLRIPKAAPQFIPRITQGSQTAEAADDNPVGPAVSATKERHNEIIHRGAKVVAL